MRPILLLLAGFIATPLSLAYSEELSASDRQNIVIETVSYDAPNYTLTLCFRNMPTRERMCNYIITTEAGVYDYAFDAAHSFCEYGYPGFPEPIYAVYIVGSAAVPHPFPVWCQ